MLSPKHVVLYRRLLLVPVRLCFSQELFSTKYQLSFNSVMNRGGTASTKELVVGRSRQCDMVLDYRCVQDFDKLVYRLSSV